MGKGNGLSRGDVRRNARLVRLRSVVRPELGITAIDLADEKQVSRGNPRWVAGHQLRSVSGRPLGGRLSAPRVLVVIDLAEA